MLDGVVIAAAGTPARLVAAGVTTAGGTRRALVAIEDFRTPYGLLPVKSTAAVEAIAPGVVVAATTQARVEHLGDRFAIEVPFPFALGGDEPTSIYTPVPVATARPVARPLPTKSPRR